MSGLTPNRMQQILDEAAERFDWVILDTPPVACCPTPTCWPPWWMPPCWSCAPARTPLRRGAEGDRGLGRDRILGVVLNGVDRMPEHVAAPRLWLRLRVRLTSYGELRKRSLTERRPLYDRVVLPAPHVALARADRSSRRR